MPGCTRECLLSLICALSFALIDCFDIGISTKCVSVPKEMGLCQDVGYTEMRLPNLMGHTTLREVIPKSAEWESLLRTGCHTHSATFLCSLFAPVCLDTFLQPCRSLCVAVRDSCSQVLTCHGQSWPDAFDCDRFPADEDTCLTSISTESSTYRKSVKVTLRKRKRASGDSEFEVEGRVEMISPGSLFPFGTRTIIQQWLLINTNCAHKLTLSNNRAVQYVLIGN
eukprot:g42200.t1